MVWPSCWIHQIFLNPFGVRLSLNPDHLPLPITCLAVVTGSGSTCRFSSLTLWPKQIKQSDRFIKMYKHKLCAPSKWLQLQLPPSKSSKEVGRGEDIETLQFQKSWKLKGALMSENIKWSKWMGRCLTQRLVRPFSQGSAFFSASCVTSVGLANVISLNWLFQLNMISLPGTAVYSFKAGGFEALDKQADYSRTARRVVFIQAALREVQRGQLHPSRETCPAFQCELTLHQSNRPHTPSPNENLQFMWPPGGLVSR